MVRASSRSSAARRSPLKGTRSGCGAAAVGDGVVGAAVRGPQEASRSSRARGREVIDPVVVHPPPRKRAGSGLGRSGERLGESGRRASRSGGGGLRGSERGGQRGGHLVERGGRGGDPTRA